MKQATIAIFSPAALKRQLAGIFLARIMARAKVELEAAQLIELSAADTEKISAAMPAAANLNATGNGESMFCIFSGENAVQAVTEVMKNLRDCFGENLVISAAESEVAAAMTAAAAIAARCNLLTSSPASGEERTLLIIKPENFRAPSVRPGAIIDMLSSLDLRWVGCKVHHMTTNDALEFYGPVQQALRSKLGPKIGSKALAAVESEFAFKFSAAAAEELVETVGNGFADDQFEQIVEFMSGKRPSEVPVEERDDPGTAKCMVLIFDGVDAVARIRTILGPTNPAQAPGGTVRYDFGTDIMVNASHASDSVESFEREGRIVRVNENDFSSTAKKFA